MTLRLALPIAVGAMLALSACQDTKRALGLEKTVPDEFAVLNRGPLVVPPDFKLRPPAPGADRPQELPAAEQARSALIGRAKLDAMKARGLSRGETQILAKAGADQVPPDVRKSLDKEASVFAAEDKSFTDRLLFWRDSAPRIGGTALDPVAEQKRLSQNQAEGKKANEGKVPVITKGGSSGWLGIF